MQNFPAVDRAFSEKRHTQGAWATRSARGLHPVGRAIACFVSLKREGVDRLARRIDVVGPVLDLGCGTGAYAHWLLRRRCGVTVVAVDWSEHALRTLPPSQQGKILRVCADMRLLPFRTDAFCGAMSVDALGHVVETERVLDELARVLRSGAPMFLHSECADYRQRWPDRVLMNRLGRDFGAELDGHVGIRPSEEVRAMLSERFSVRRFSSPAGILGWLLGYPEKYAPAFALAHMRVPWLVTTVFAFVKNMPTLGMIQRVVNAVGNRLELLIGLSGGGSFFAEIVKRKHAFSPSPISGRGVRGEGCAENR